MPRKTPTNTTPKKPKQRRDWKTPFLAALREHGVVVVASRAAKIDKTTAYDARQKDEAFAAQWDEAIEDSVGSAEAELFRRGVKGTLKPVFQGGAKVGTIREYSDTALIFYLKAHRPEKYREAKSEVHVHNESPAIPSDVAAIGLAAMKQAMEAKGRTDGKDGTAGGLGRP